MLYFLDHPLAEPEVFCAELSGRHVPCRARQERHPQVFFKIAHMRVRDAIYYTLTGDTFNGKRAAEIGFVTFSVPRASLMEEVKKVAAKLAEKDALALRACKDAYRDSLLIPDFETALSYSSAKSDQLSFLQGGAWFRSIRDIVPMRSSTS